MNQGAGSERVFSPPQGGSGRGQVMEHQRRSSGGSGSHTPTEQHSSPHQSPHQMLPADYYHKEWGAGIPTHYPGMPGGYPGMYNPPMPGLPYPGPPGQPIPGANYPYAMPYPWGHHPAQLGPHGEHMIQQQMQQAGAQRSSEGIQAVRHEGQGYPHGRPQHVQPGTAAMFKDQAAAAAAFVSVPVSSPPGGVASRQPTMEKVPPPPHSSSSHIPTPATLHQLGTSPHSIPHQLTHALSRPTAHSIAPDHLPHPSFPYSFDAGSHPSLHMWQQQAQPMRPIPGMHPAHLTPSMAPHGLWYSSTGHHVPAHLMQGQELLVKKPGGKLKANRGESHAKITANRNSNNSNKNDVTSLEEGRFPSSSQPTADVAYSAHHLAATRKLLGTWGGGGPTRLPADCTHGSYVPLVTSLPPPPSSTSEHASEQPTPYDW